MKGIRRITLVGIKQLSQVALCIAISSFILQACQSPNMPTIDVQDSTRSETRRILIKATVSECELRGGEYVRSASIVPNDIVDCLLPRGLLRLVKATVSDCQIRGGKFVEPASTAPVDIVDCLLPKEILRGQQLPDLGPQIVGNVYDYLFEPGTEKPGCGLYSYVLFPVDNSRSESLLDVVFTTMSYVERSGLACDNFNVLYLPTKVESLDNLFQLMRHQKEQNRAAVFADEFYDYALARQLLGQVCLKPPNTLRKVCASDLSRGPYLFTYGTPVSVVSPVPPPFLFVDLSNVHERAFKEFAAAYKEQVKRTIFSDRKKIDTFRLNMLSIVLTAADWVGPIRGAIADTLHLTLDADQD